MENKSLTDSRFAAYEGIIALAWADHVLDAQEKSELHDKIDGNLYMSEAQRKALHVAVDNKISLETVWPRITEKKDRAFLLNMADLVFHADGEFCQTESELYEKYLQQHLATLDQQAIQAEISQLAIMQKAEREQLEQDLVVYQKQFSLKSRLAAFFGFGE